MTGPVIRGSALPPEAAAHASSGRRQPAEVPRIPRPALPPGRNPPAPTSASTDVRKWALEHGLITAERGRLPKAVLEAYAEAHSGDQSEGKPGPGRSERATSAAKADTAASPESQTRAAGSRARKATARTGKDREPRTSPVKPRQPARPIARSTAPPRDLEERLTAVETQLAIAVARLESLEGKMTKSLLGLRVTL